MLHNHQQQWSCYHQHSTQQRVSVSVSQQPTANSQPPTANHPTSSHIDIAAEQQQSSLPPSQTSASTKHSHPPPNKSSQTPTLLLLLTNLLEDLMFKSSFKKIMLSEMTPTRPRSNLCVVILRFCVPQDSGGIQIFRFKLAEEVVVADDNDDVGK